MGYGEGATGKEGSALTHVNYYESAGAINNNTPNSGIVASANGVIPVATAVSLSENPNVPYIPNNNNWLNVSYESTTTPCIPDNGNWANSQNPRREIMEMKRKRKKKATISGVAGGFVGFILLGPIGGVITGVATAVVVKKKLKRKDEKKLRNLNARTYSHHFSNN